MCHALRLSPFFLGPVSLYDGHVAKNVENAWQYAKVYKQHVDPVTGEPTAEYWEWALAGWANPDPVRFPMGRGAKPEYSYWDGKKYGYVAARKRIYAPLYASLVENSVAFKKLAKIYRQNKRLYLWDFDGYDHVSMGRTLQQVLDDPNKKMGHAFVLLMLLRGERLWETDDIPELDYDPKARERVPKPEPRGPLTSAGFLIKSADLYLVCHATNRKPPAATDGSWTISKGIVDADETPIEAAIRELKEETGIDLKGEEPLTSLIPAPDAQPINSYTVGKGAAKKTVLVYEIDDKEGLLRLHRTKELTCTSLIEGDYSPVHVRGLPELDAFSWVTQSDAQAMVFQSQKHLFGPVPERAPKAKAAKPRGQRGRGPAAAPEAEAEGSKDD